MNTFAIIARCAHLQQHLEEMLENHGFHVVILGLVIIDVLIVFAQLLVDHDIVSKYYIVSKNCISVSIA